MSRLSLALSLGLLLMVASLAGADEASLAAENARLRAENAALRTQVDQLRQENRRLSGLAGVVPASDKAAAQDAKITSDYQEKAGRTTVTSAWSKVKAVRGSRADHSMRVSFDHAGTPEATPAGVTTIQWQIYASQSNGRLRGVKSLSITLADGSKLELPVTDYSAKSRSLPAGQRSIEVSDEMLTLAVPMATARQLGEASRAGVDAGVTDLELDADDLALFKAMVMRATASAAPVTASPAVDQPR